MLFHILHYWRVKCEDITCKYTMLFVVDWSISILVWVQPVKPLHGPLCGLGTQYVNIYNCIYNAPPEVCPLVMLSCGFWECVDNLFYSYPLPELQGVMSHALVVLHKYNCPSANVASLNQKNWGPLFTKKTPSYQYGDSHYKPETVVRPSKVYNGDPYTRKTASS